MLPAGLFNIAGLSILLYRFLGVRAIFNKALNFPGKQILFLWEGRIEVSCFCAEHCEHAHWRLICYHVYVVCADVDEDGEKITVRSDGELKAMFKMVCMHCMPCFQLT